MSIHKVWSGIVLVLLLAGLVFGLIQLGRSRTMLRSSQDEPLTVSPLAISPPIQLSPTVQDKPPPISSPVVSPTARSLPTLQNKPPLASPLATPKNAPLSPTLDDEPPATAPPPVGSKDSQSSAPTGPVVRDSVKNDVSPPLHDITPIPPEPGELREIPLYPLPNRGGKK